MRSLDENKQHLQGSESRDIFKRSHKEKLGGWCYASDIDLVIVRKTPPGIVAYFDYKKPRDSITFAEVLVYNELMRSHDVFIIESSNPESGPFDIYKYQGGDFRPEPPTIRKELVRRGITWDEFQMFEDELRRVKK